MRYSREDNQFQLKVYTYIHHFIQVVYSSNGWKIFLLSVYYMKMTKTLPPWTIYYMGIMVANKYTNKIDNYK